MDVWRICSRRTRPSPKIIRFPAAGVNLTSEEWESHKQEDQDRYSMSTKHPNFQVEVDDY